MKEREREREETSNKISRGTPFANGSQVLNEEGENWTRFLRQRNMHAIHVAMWGNSCCPNVLLIASLLEVTQPCVLK